MSAFSQCRPVVTPAGPCVAQPERLIYVSPMLEDGEAALDEYKYVGPDDFYVCRIVDVADLAGFTRRFRNADGLYLSNTPHIAPVELVFSPPLRIPGGGSLGIELVNNGGGPFNDIIHIDGFRKFYEDSMNRYASPVELGLTGDTPPGFKDAQFVYNFDVAEIDPLSAPGQLPLKIDSDSDFIWRSGAFVAEAGTAAAIRLRFTDGQGRYRSNTRIPVGLLFTEGISNFSPIFPEIHLPAGCTIYFDIENTDAAPVENFQLAMCGVKRFPA
jgi:hypothetical protein